VFILTIKKEIEKRNFLYTKSQIKKQDYVLIIDSKKKRIIVLTFVVIISNTDEVKDDRIE
jgi:hypothetical protein